MPGLGFLWIVRLFLSLVMLAAMVVLFVVPTAAWCVWLDWLPRAQFVPAVWSGSAVTLTVLMASFVLFGRLYCSTVCPLGAAQDLARLVLGHVRLPQLRVWTPLRYAVLGLFAAGVVLGWTGLIEPYGIFGRFLVAAVMRWGTPSAGFVAWTIALFAFVLAMTVFRARWWCNQVCPVGTLLGFFSRFAVFRVKIDRSRCVNCNLCVKACDKGCIAADKGKHVDSSQCVICLKCMGVCGKGALTWR